MNRIRKINGIYQVLLTPNIRISPDSSLILGLFEDSSLRGFSIVDFDNMRGWHLHPLENSEGHRSIGGKSIEEIIELRDSGDSLQRIADDLGLTKSMVQRALDREFPGGKGLKWKDCLPA